MDKEKQYSEMANLINEIQKFREINKGKCVSTTHAVDFYLFCGLTNVMASSFPKMTVEFKGYGKEVFVTIPMK